MLVVRSVLSSSRPWPLSTSRARRSAGTSGACPEGGKGGRDRPGRRLVAEARPHVYLQPWLVALGKEDVVALLLDDLGAHVALAEDGVAQHDLAFDGQDAQ